MSTPPLSNEVLRRRALTLMAVSGETVVASATFAPGASVSVGSNSGNELVLPERFELLTFTLVTDGAVLHLAPPLFVTTTVWRDGEPLDLKGHFRDLKRKWPDLPDALPLASDRFLVRYATGIALLGRYNEVGVTA